MRLHLSESCMIRFTGDLSVDSTGDLSVEWLRYTKVAQTVIGRNHINRSKSAE